MATVNFLYRSKKDKAPLNLRLLYRYNDTDFVLGARTNLIVSKHYWNNQHNQKRIKDIEISNMQTEVNNEINKIENHILNAFNSTDPETVNKEWLKKQMDLFYNPITVDKSIPKNLVDFIDFHIEYRKNELKPTSVKKFKVIKHKLERLEEKRKKPILIKDINDKFKNEFVSYLKSENYAQNTMQRELVFIKTFCKHARFLGLETHPQLAKNGHSIPPTAG
ncbi:MAG: hypothetical protein COW66_06975 [Flavobacteriaceae bacterium CG18_big_fil_WC_8_21_14_2_50_34_36]|nr:MAG: hypothetical protein COW66_06975 [Flavobacteriaceae bacterium CG18_big_fil_WC_8_21_14_2_50_34_36]